MNKKSRSLSDLLISMNKTLEKDTVNTILDKIDTCAELKTNDLLIGLFESLDKDIFNTIIEQWAAEVIKDNFDEIVTKDKLETVENYHKHLREIGYLGERVKVSRVDEGILIEMQGGCPYGVFCKSTQDKKCIRGSALKYLLNQSNLLIQKHNKENDEQIPNDNYAPMLEKIPTEQGYMCKIYIKTHDDVAASVINGILENEKHVL